MPNTKEDQFDKAKRYSPDRRTEEDKDFFDKYSATGESEWTRGSIAPFDDDVVLSERHYQIGPTSYDRATQFSRPIRRDFPEVGPVNITAEEARLYHDVSDALYQCPEVDPSDVVIRVKGGTVNLSGIVQSLVEKKIVEIVVERLPGVIEVVNDLKIEKPKRKGLMSGQSPLP